MAGPAATQAYELYGITTLNKRLRRLFYGVFDHEAESSHTEAKKWYLKTTNHTVAVFELARDQHLTQYPFVTNHVWKGVPVSLVVLPAMGHKYISLLVEIFSVASSS